MPLAPIHIFSSDLAKDQQQDWYEKNEKPILEVVLPATNLAQALACANLLSERSGCSIKVFVIEDDIGFGFIQISNLMFKSSNAPFFAYVAQDAFPGRYWASIAIKSLENSKQGLLAFNDGKWFGKLAAFGLLRRNWANKNYNGNLFHPGYQSHYADTELTLIASQENQLCYNANAVLVEVDYDKDKKGNNPHDKNLYAERKLKMFDGKVYDSTLLNMFS